VALVKPGRGACWNVRGPLCVAKSRYGGQKKPGVSEVPNRSAPPRSWIVSFINQGKTLFLTISLYPGMTGDAVRLAERLYRLLEVEAEIPPAQTAADKIFHRRYALLPIDLQDFRGDKGEDMDIGFTIGGSNFQSM
jgi:hypothetical protein